MTINRKIVPSGLKNNPNKTRDKSLTVTIHETGNFSATATAKSHADYQYGGSGGTQTSWHYTVDGKEVWQSFEDNALCWHAGDGNGAGNASSIAIEICVNDKAAFSAACDNAAELTAELLKRHNLSVSAVKQHNDWSGKNCPEHLRAGSWGVTWPQFLERVNKNMGSATKAGTPIMGAATATAEQMGVYLSLKNPTMNSPKCYELAKYFILEGNNEGVRGDVAFAQSCLETGNWKFGGDVKPEQNNFAGLGTTGGGVAGNSFPTPQEGIRAQIQHLKAYASNEPLKQACVDTRFNLITRGCAEFVEWLGQKENPSGKGWAAGADYGAKILTILSAIMAVDVPKEQTPADVAVDVLSTAGIINSPEHWKQAAVSGQSVYIKDLLVKVAEYVTKHP